jgi:polar amino acid transport system substrate-binding protein
MKKASLTAKTVLTALTALVLAISLTGSGCGSDKPAGAKTAETGGVKPKARVFRADDFNGKTFAILTGSSFDAAARKVVGAAQLRYYNTITEAMGAVLSGDVDATLAEEPVARKFAAQNPQLAVLYPPVEIENYAYVFPKRDSGKLRDEFNAFMVRTRLGGTYEDMVRRWIDSPQPPPMPEIPLNPESPDKKLIFATTDSDEPFSFRTSEGKLEGFDVELALRFARDRGYGAVEFQILDFPDIIPAVRNGKADLASNLITVTEERKALVDFSEPYYYGGTVAVVKK